MLRMRIRQKVKKMSSDITLCIENMEHLDADTQAIIKKITGNIATDQDCEDNGGNNGDNDANDNDFRKEGKDISDTDAKKEGIAEDGEPEF